MDYRAIGLVELNSVAKGVESADAMLKASDVQLLMARSVCPGRYLAMISGDVGSVENAIDAGKETAGEFLVDRFVIPNVHPSVFPALSCSTAIEGLGALGQRQSQCHLVQTLAHDLHAPGGDGYLGGLDVHDHQVDAALDQVSHRFVGPLVDKEVVGRHLSRVHHRSLQPVLVDAAALDPDPEGNHVAHHNDGDALPSSGQDAILTDEVDVAKVKQRLALACDRNGGDGRVDLP